MTSYSLTLEQLRNVEYPEKSPERAQQKAQEDKAIGAFAEALKKFDYADSNAPKREVELEVAKVRERTGVPVQYESSFWNQGSVVFPKEMIESSVRATLARITTQARALPIDGNQEEGYSVAISDLASAAPDLAKEAKAEQQKEVHDLKAALTDAANKTLEAHGWDLHGHNLRWLKYQPQADSLPQTSKASSTLATASAVNPPTTEIHAETTHALEKPPPDLSKPESIGVKMTVAARTLPEKIQDLSQHAQSKARNTDTIAEISELVEKTRLAALESASASKDVVLSLGGLAVNPPAAEIHAETTGERPPVLAKPKSMGGGQPVVARTLPEKPQHLSHRAQIKAQNANTIAEISELAKKTRLAALESASASKDVIRSLDGLTVNPPVPEIQTETTYALGEHPPTLSKPESIGVDTTIVAGTLPTDVDRISKA